MARVVGLFLYESEGADPRPVETAIAGAGGGLEGDRHGARPGRRMLLIDGSVLVDLGLSPGSLREQITVEGLPELNSLEAGTRLTLGETTLEIVKPCAPCLTIAGYIGAEDREALRESLEGRRGMFVEFVDVQPGTKLSIGDEVRVL